MEPLELLKAYVKLGERHLLEWNTLVANQLKTLELVKEKFAQTLGLVVHDRITLARLKSQQSIQLNRLMVKQLEERQQARVRQKQEKILLKQTSESINHDSN